MSDTPSPASPALAQPSRSSGDRLDSWKEIAAYLRRDVTTVQRWEKREGMPVHRHRHDRAGSVYAFRSQLDAWSNSRAAVASEPRHDRQAGDEPDRADGGEVARADQAAEPLPAPTTDPSISARAGRRRAAAWLSAGAVLLIAATLLIRQLSPGELSAGNPLGGASFVAVTNFGGLEQAAALSRDGRFAAFLSNHDGRMDVWLTQVGSGRFHNLTHGAAGELVNSAVRTLGFSPDGSLVTFWARRSNGPEPSSIDIWCVPVLGGPARPYLEGAAEFDWSRDGTRLVYHTPGPGDPTFVRGPGATERRIFSAPPGLHAHFPVWSPDQAFIYFALGAAPDAMDLWRMTPSGASLERLTNHRSRVSYPVFLNAHTLLYLASDSDNPGQRLYSLDLGRKVSKPIGLGVERYTSLSGSADGRQLVATVSTERSTLWRLPMSSTRIDTSAGRRIDLTTQNGFAPRLADHFLLYVSSKGESDSLWKVSAEAATDLWAGPPGSRIVEAPAISRDGDRIAFIVESNGQRSLYIVRADGTDAHALSSSLEFRGTPAWSPDGRLIAVGATVGGIPRLLSVPLDGRSPTPLIEEQSLDPAWSPDGTFLAYSGADVGTMFEVKTAGMSRGVPAPKLTLRRGSSISRSCREAGSWWCCGETWRTATCGSSISKRERSVN